MKPVVIITGASGGLGAEIALRFGLAGGRVVINDVAYLDDARALAEKIEAAGGEAFVHYADVCRYEQVEGMAKTAVARWGRIDVLVNNAGGGSRWLGKDGQLVTEMEETAWDNVINVNLKGTFFCIKAVAPQMIRQKSGHVINIFSGHGLRGARRFSAYSAAKAGVVGLTRSVAQELGEHNIKVNAVSPGLILHARAKKEETISRERAEPWIARSVLRRSGDASEFAEFVVQLSRMENVSGQALDLDSGIHG